MSDVYAMNLRHLDALSAIGRAGSMSSAASQVSLSQPALTQAIGKVEAMAGARLFERQPGGMVPTAAGRAMIIRVERALRYLTQGVRLVRRSARLAPVTHIERRVTMAQLRALIAVENTSSYALAATQTGLSQPAVHRAVRDLQTFLGTALLIRVGRAVRPTDVASRFVRFARLMLSELRTGMDEVAAMDAGDGGRIRVGTLPMARAVFLPELLGQFAAAHPAASVEVREAPYDELLHALRHGDIDLLVGGAWRDPSPANDVVQEKLFYDQLAIVGNATHPLRNKKRPTAADLLRFPWVIPAHGVPMRSNWERMFHALGVESPTPTIECSSVLVTRGLMLKGDWLTLMSRDQFLFERAAGALTEIGSPGEALRRLIALTRRGDWRPTPLQAHFVDMAHRLAAERNG
ncbi:LysR family transcriptional regulator [Dyella monticola]|uniref:LysR family transcriptional regulator n=1 Tax=Dyella monticola TaxID=1927958 RepID=A0A370X382_9GAMM|nr:LysR family transcriptional regulator [Dyella monticola]RDS82806.1 LysR family transcriptional regulator [Dyella monticola]